MTKQEAIQAMKKGVKVTHWLFTPNEYVFIHPEKNVLMDENNYELSWFEFWKYRENPNFETGWSECKENNSEKMEHKEIEFNKKERSIIADYVYSYHSDILIVSDAVSLLEVLNNHNLVENYDALKNGIANKEKGLAEQLLILIIDKISENQRIDIMKEYFGNYKTDLENIIAFMKL